MEQWEDQAIVLQARPHGENGAVVSLLTEAHGRHAGYVRGAHSSKMRGTLEAGTLVSVAWKARSHDELGSYVLEQERSYAAPLMGDPLTLEALLSACALCDAALPEREGHAGLFYGLQALFEALGEEHWGAVYVMWEIALLKELGFALELTQCAEGGDPATLAYVSPKTGRAVSEAVAAPYKERLLDLPEFLTPHPTSPLGRGEGQAGDADDILKGLKLTGYFLEHWAFAHHTRGVPEKRIQFQARFEKSLSS